MKRYWGFLQFKWSEFCTSRRDSEGERGTVGKRGLDQECLPFTERSPLIQLEKETHVSKICSPLGSVEEKRVMSDGLIIKEGDYRKRTNLFVVE